MCPQDLQDTEAIDPNAKKLNERQRSMAQLIFVGIDMDGSGTLDEAECKQVMGKQAAGLFKFDAAKKGMASGAQEGGDKLIDIGEWMKYLIQKKINEGSESLDEMLEQMEEQVSTGGWPDWAAVLQRTIYCWCMNRCVGSWSMGGIPTRGHVT